MAAKKTFSWKTWDLMNRFSKFQRHMIIIDSMHMWKILVLEIYFRFERENSKRPPKTTFSWISRELMNRFSKFQRHMITINSMHMWKILVLKIYLRFARENSKWPPKTTFSWITRELMDIFSKFQRHMITIDSMHMWNILVLKIYFRFTRENSKWLPKTTFS